MGTRSRSVAVSSVTTLSKTNIPHGYFQASELFDVDALSRMGWFKELQKDYDGDLRQFLSETPCYIDEPDPYKAPELIDDQPKYKSKKDLVFIPSMAIYKMDRDNLVGVFVHEFSHRVDFNSPRKEQVLKEDEEHKRTSEYLVFNYNYWNSLGETRARRFEFLYYLNECGWSKEELREVFNASR